jgi:DNA modification methylase
MTRTRSQQARLEHVPLSELKRAPRNPKGHDLDNLGASIDRFGFVMPLLIDERTGRLVAGHGRLERLESMRDAGDKPPSRILTDDSGDWLVPVIKGVRFKNEAEAEAYLIADNRQVELGGWDDEPLLEMLKEQETAGTLDGIGYSSDDVDLLLAQVAASNGNGSEPTDPEQIPEPPAKPTTRKGDIWQLGPHRLICGDCRDLKVVGRVLAGATVNLAFTSPPYADRRKYDETSGFEPIHPDDYVDWFEAAQANVAAHLADDGSWFVNIKPGAEGLDREIYVIDLVVAHARDWGWHFAEEFCWERAGFPGEPRLRFKNQFEPVYQFTRGRWKFRPQTVRHLAQRAFQYEPERNRALIKDQGTPGDWFADHESLGEGIAYPGNRLQTFAQTHEAMNHAAAFPVGLPEFFVKAYTDQGDTVLDPFTGTGSTLLAAHNQDRTGYGIEISRGYCDVIVERFERVTDIKAKRVKA